MNFEFFSDVPLALGAWLHAAVWSVLLVWVFRRPTDEIYEGAPDRARWRDLRWWILPLGALQIAIYFMF